MGSILGKILLWLAQVLLAVLQLINAMQTPVSPSRDNGVHRPEIITQVGTNAL